MNYKNYFIKAFVLTIVIFSTTAKIAATSCAPPADHYRPIYMPLEEFRNAVKSLQPIDLSNPTKILVHENFLFIVEEDKGIHVIDNNDPRNPTNLSFINVPGVHDITSKGNTLYADSAIDLVALNIIDPTMVVETARLQDIYSSELTLASERWEKPVDPSKGIVIGKTFVGKSKCKSSFSEPTNNNIFSCSESSSASSVTLDNATNTGVNGSTSKMVVVDDYLYLLNQENIKTIHIADPNSPVVINTELLGWDIETIFYQESNLYIGGQTGVRILDISNPTFPTYVSTYQHTWQCDPIVVKGTIGYVTLRRGSRCRGDESALQIIDLTDITNPQFIESYPLDDPYGLSIDNNFLFVTNTNNGFMIFDVSDYLDIQLISSFSIGPTYDVITRNSMAVIVGQNGVYQYNYQDINNVTQLSLIPVKE